MKYQLIEFPHNSDLPASVRRAIPDEAVQTVFRGLLNAHLREGKSEMHAYIKAYRALEEQGYTRNDQGLWEVKKDSPAVGDVHVNRPMGAIRPKQPKGKDDPGTQDKDDPGSQDPELDYDPELVMKTISGQADISLNTKGKLLANNLGRRLAAKGGLDVLYSSDLNRAVQTADAIKRYATASLAMAKPTDELRPWRMGGLEGGKSKDKQDIIVSYIENPDEVPPGDGRDGEPGESFNTAKKRLLDCLSSIKQDAEDHPNLKIGVIMHARAEDLLQHWVDADCPEDYDIKTKDLIEDPDKVDHADVLRWGKKIKEVDLEESDELEPGVFLIMHSLTDEDNDEGNPDLQKLYLPPIEVHRDAKLAYEAGTVVLDITSTLAHETGNGLSVEGIKKIDAHFAAVESATESELSRNAWGGRFAAKWARRVLAKVAKGGPGSEHEGESNTANKAEEKEFAPWIAVDLDGTLAMHSGSNDGTVIGAPVPAMVNRVREWIKEGKEVRIFTARVAKDPGGKIKAAVEQWSQTNIGRVLPITNKKDPGMLQLWDDKAIGVVRNEGIAKTGNGIMVSLQLDPDTANLLAIPNGEAPEELHITLAYFGKLPDVDVEMLPKLENAIEAFAALQAPISGALGGPGRFNATDHSDGKDVVFAQFESRDIQEFRCDLIDCLEALGLDAKNNFGYIPHVTLAYIEPNSDFPIQHVGPTEITFDRITLNIGGARKDYFLTGGSVEKGDDEHWVTVNGNRVLIGADGKPTAGHPLGGGAPPLTKNFRGTEEEKKLFSQAVDKSGLRDYLEKNPLEQVTFSDRSAESDYSPISQYKDGEHQRVGEMNISSAIGGEATNLVRVLGGTSMDEMRTAVIHEAAHHVEWTSKSEAIVDKAYSKETKFPSKYGGTSAREYYAEAFTARALGYEYKLSSNASQMLKAVDKSAGLVKKSDADFELVGEIIKLDKQRQLCFGWFSIVTVEGKSLTDTQGDIIDPETIENSAYDFVLHARKGGEMHDKQGGEDVVGIGRLVESVVFTKEKQRAMLDSLIEQGINATLDLRCEAWWGGFYIENLDTWSKVTTGKLRAWSIGGNGKRAAI